MPTLLKIFGFLFLSLLFANNINIRIWLISSDIRKEWPNGIKTIPIYYFLAEINHLSDDLFKVFTIIKKEEALEKIEKYKDAYLSI